MERPSKLPMVTWVSVCRNGIRAQVWLLSVTFTSRQGPSIPVPMLTFVFMVELETNHSIELTIHDSNEGFHGCTSVQVLETLRYMFKLGSTKQTTPVVSQSFALPLI